MAKKFFFFSILSLLLFFSLSNFSFAAAKTCNTDAECPDGQLCAEREVEGVVKKSCERALEISYPKVPGGGVVPETTATGLPNYVKYIFQLSVAVIGFVIFAVMVYNGAVFLSSTGNPAKLTDAREGILSGFLGTIILLSAYIIFNTINPQLTILKLAEVSPLGGVVTPGVYICNYNVDEAINKMPKYQAVKNVGWTFNDILNAYIDKDWRAKDDRVAADQQIWAVERLKEFNCPRVNSANLNGWVVKPDNTVFIVPELSYVWNKTDNKTVKQIKYEYGIVFFEKDNWKGRCDYYPKEYSGNLIYTYTPTSDIPYIPNLPDGCKASGKGQQIDECRPKDLKFEAKSITVFKKPNTEPPGTARGVVLYSCIDYNSTEGMCPKSVTTPIERPYPTSGADMLKVRQNDLKISAASTLADNTRSISIEPQGSYFALLFDGGKDGTLGDFEGQCTGNYTSFRDVRKYPIEKRGPDCATWRSVSSSLGVSFLLGINSKECALGVRSMIVIKGLAI